MRRDFPFMEVNCAAITEPLFESALFGHEKGVFTDAKSAKKGLMELADRGTLFLDEVSEMSLNSQAKFLRVLQERVLRRVGGTRDIKRSEEHTSELQSQSNLVCRLLLEKKKK